METIQVVLDAKLLKAADRAASRWKVNRSALIREDLRGHLRKLETMQREETDRAGFLAKPAKAGAWAAWEAEVKWPAD